MSSRSIFRWLAGWLCVQPALLSGMARGEDDPKFLHVQAGELPIILSAPHGGKLEIPDVKPREGEGLKKQPGGFVVSRDTATEELALQVSEALEARFGKKPYLVASRAHRKYLDPNREPSAAYEEPAAKAVYDEYHKTLAGYCRDVQKTYRQGLLLDLHGQSSAKDTVFRGTKHGLTVSLLRERYGEAAYSGEASLFGRLKALGWTVHPDPHDGKEQAGYTGGYIVQTYGSHQGFGIDAIQLEFGGDYRSTPDAREKTAATLADAVADYAVRYLNWKLPAAPVEPAAATCEVAVYQGDGASNSREALMKVLKTQPKCTTTRGRCWLRRKIPTFPTMKGWPDSKPRLRRTARWKE